jgi:hypothetical protein
VLLQILPVRRVCHLPHPLLRLCTSHSYSLSAEPIRALRLARDYTFLPIRIITRIMAFQHLSGIETIYQSVTLQTECRGLAYVTHQTSSSNMSHYLPCIPSGLLPAFCLLPQRLPQFLRKSHPLTLSCHT